MKKPDRPLWRCLASLAPAAILTLGVSSVRAQPILSPSLAAIQLHQAPSAFRDTANLAEPLPPEDPSGRFGLQNLLEARWLVSSSTSDGDVELERLGGKMLLALPLLGHDNLGELLLEPRAHLIVDLVERGVYSLRHRRPRRLSPPPGTLAVDTHVHTCFSHDSVADPERMVLAAARRGLSAIVVTDHGTTKGARRAIIAARRLARAGRIPADFMVIVGEEVSSREGHIGGLFLQRDIPEGLSAAETIAAIHAQGGVAVAAHPLLASGVGALAATLPFDAVESANAVESLRFAAGPAAAQARRAEFYAGLRLPHLGSSDAHDPGAVGACYTLLRTEDRTADGLRKALLAADPPAIAMDEGLPGRRMAGKSWARGAYHTIEALTHVMSGPSDRFRRLTGADAGGLSLGIGPAVALRWTKHLP
jgi:predicted metal-dependent phosphoesterase TrpH